jgi:hypothetical protein
MSVKAGDSDNKGNPVYKKFSQQVFFYFVGCGERGERGLPGEVRGS